MKRRILSAVVVAFAVTAFGCDSPEPFAPGPADLGPQASRADAGPRPILAWQELVLTSAPPPQVVDGFLVISDFVFEGEATGDLAGHGSTLTNAIIDLATGGGPAWGTYSITSEGGGWDGSFKGLLTPNPAGSTFFDGTFTLRGTGGNKGRKITGTFTDRCDDGCLSGAPGDGDGLERYKFEGVMVGRPGGPD